LQRLYVKLPKGVPWLGRGRILDLYPVGKTGGPRMIVTVAYVSIAVPTSKQGYVDVRGWVVSPIQ